ncbi:MAG: phosphoribosyltransferase family protein [Candidatus Paceibacterota bacterium]|jgi:ComF family protein
MDFLDTILSLVFPIKCAICGKAGLDFCSRCLEDCPRAERESAKWIFPLYDYRHPPIKKSLWLFKYKGKRRLAKIFAEILYENMLEELADLAVLENFNNTLLVPIPLSRKRLRERGYNQAALICREILKINIAQENSGVKFELSENALVKPKETEHQAHIKDRKRRMENMRGTFQVDNPAIVAGRNIILIDDILTTGATLSEARRTLKDAGARKVIAFTLAH